MKHRSKQRTQLALLTSGSPPSEFRIFARGWNDTSKGSFLFDDEAARSVMSAYKRDGIERMIDLEHLSTDEEARHYDPDARGWFRLELRNGELWAVGVKWTPDGAARLRDTRQRYISPAFTFDPESQRISELYNVAICAVPATFEAPPLVAASKRAGKKIETLSIEVKKMELMKAICSALGLKDDATGEEVLAAIKALQEPDGDEGKASDDKPKDEGGDDKEKPGKLDAKDGDPDGDKDKAEMAAALSKLPPKVGARIMAALVAEETLSKRVAEVEGKQRVSEVESLIAANTDKIPKSLESWARTQSADALRVYLKHAPKVARDPQREPQTEGGDADPQTVQLTAADRLTMRLTGVTDEAKYKAEKARLAKRDRDLKQERMS